MVGGPYAVSCRTVPEVLRERSPTISLLPYPFQPQSPHRNKQTKVCRQTGFPEHCLKRRNDGASALLPPKSLLQNTDSIIHLSPAEQLEQQDAAARIRQLISQLPAVQQTIIRMKDVEGYEIAEIAEITGSQVEAIF